MNAYHETMTLPSDTIDRLEALCRGPAEDCRRDECVFDREVEFDDGLRMAIQVIASSEPAEGCWTQGVLFDADGAELGCTEPDDTFAGKYVVECDGDSYTVRVTDDSRASLLLEAAAALDSIVDLCGGEPEAEIKAAHGADLAMRLRELCKSIS